MANTNLCYEGLWCERSGRTTTCRPEGLWFLFLSGFWFSGFLPQALSPALAAGPFLFIGRRLCLCICGRLFVCAFVAGSFVFTGRRLFFSALAAGPFLFINRRLFLCIGRGLSFLHWSQAICGSLSAGSFWRIWRRLFFGYWSQALFCALVWQTNACLLNKIVMTIRTRFFDAITVPPGTGKVASAPSPHQKSPTR